MFASIRNQSLHLSMNTFMGKNILGFTSRTRKVIPKTTISKSKRDQHLRHSHIGAPPPPPPLPATVGGS